MEIPQGLAAITISKILEEHDLDSMKVIVILVKSMSVLLGILNIVNVDELEKFLDNLEVCQSFKNQIRVAVTLLMLIEGKILENIEKFEGKN